MADGDGETDIVDLSGNGKGVALNVYPDAFIYDTTGTFAALAGSALNSNLSLIRTTGYAAAGDGGGALYEEVETFDIFRPATPISPALTVLKGLRRTEDLVLGMTVSGDGVAAGTTVIGITSSTVTLSAAVTGAETRIFCFHAREIDDTITDLYPESFVTLADARIFMLSRKQAVHPEMFGAFGDNEANDYLAFTAMAWHISNAASGIVELLPCAQYYIGEYATASNGIASIRFQGTRGLRFRGNGALMSFKGDFDRDASTTAGIGLRFDDCINLEVRDVELDGNVDQTTNSSQSSESPFSIGLRFGACEDFDVHNIRVHHFATDGVKTDQESETYTTYTSGAAFNRRASKRGRFYGVHSSFNGRQAYTAGAAEQMLHFHCKYTDTAQFTGTYGVGGNPGHAPKSGFDFEPTSNKSVHDTLDVDPNNIHFFYCEWNNNLGGDWKSALETVTHSISFNHCDVTVADNGTATAPINIGIPNTRVCDCTLNMKHARIDVRGGGGLATHLWIDNELSGNGTVGILFSAVNDSKHALFLRNTFVSTATAPSAHALISVADENGEFEDNDIFIPAASYVDSGGNDSDQIASFDGARFVKDNRWRTDLLAAAGSGGNAHYSINYGTAEAINETFIGTNPGTTDTFRPVAGGTAFDSTLRYSTRDTIPASTVVNTPAGTIAATDVQTALNELDTEKATAASVTSLTTTVSTKAGLRPAFVAGNWYSPVRGTVAAGNALTANSIRLQPFELTRSMTISDLGARITTLAAAGNIQLAIYGSDANLLPTGNALAATGNISTAATGAVSADITGANVTLAPGIYWMAINSDNATVVMQIVNPVNLISGFLVGSSTLATITSAATVTQFGLTIAQAFGTWPDLTAGAFAEATGSAFAIVYLKAA